MNTIAKQLVADMGAALIGREIHTIPFGAYPGGVAKVTELTPDPQAPEIVMQVEHPTFGSIGVFEDEPVELAS
jgi:hypothetical protein